MTPELETYFDNYNELFNHEGFKQLLQELSNNAQQLADIQTVKDTEELFFRKGQVAAFATVINLQGTIEAARDQAEDGIRDFCLSRGLGDVYKRQTRSHAKRLDNYIKVCYNKTMVNNIRAVSYTHLTLPTKRIV